MSCTEGFNLPCSFTAITLLRHRNKFCPIIFIGVFSYRNKTVGVHALCSEFKLAHFNEILSDFRDALLAFVNEEGRPIN